MAAVPLWLLLLMVWGRGGFRFVPWRDFCSATFILPLTNRHIGHSGTAADFPATDNHRFRQTGAQAMAGQVHLTVVTVHHSPITAPGGQGAESHT